MSLTLHIFPVSPFARVVQFFVAEEGMDVEVKVVNLMAGEQKSEEYLAINPNGKVPALTVGQGDDAYHLYESKAILRYLSQVSNSDLYPLGKDDLRRSAEVDVALEDITSLIQKPIAEFTYAKVIKKIFTGEEPDAEAVAAAEALVGPAFEVVNKRYFKTSKECVVGNEISVADLYLAVWVAQLQLANYNVKDLGLEPLNTFLDAISQRDSYKAAHD
eukprot:CAMPEP_0174260852 /NCGR_PEP_ID=MMETSP0439-20130205/10736_1 /TAXON_ID=0 /ORGANISM="Stereomyxa ramosa, Strain Chinc5" /LENGTH=216 /DNA_ID=CAMNT_0015345197 /DNA_START=99 /DNA_END=746 /DNA_ORIENTATION=+